MPHMDGILDEGKILCWMKIVGDSVKQGDLLAEVETNKVNIEIESPASGFIRAIFATEGEMVATGTIIAFVGAVNEPLPDLEATFRRPVEVLQRGMEKTNQLSWSPLWILGWLGGLLGLAFVFWLRRDWLTIVFTCAFLISFCIFLKKLIRKQKSNTILKRSR